MCNDCATPKYDFTDEYGGSFSYTGDGQYSQRYLDGTELTGNWATDTVCVSSDSTTCVNNFKFVAVHTANGLAAEEDGIVGMSQSDNIANILYVP